MLIQQVAGDATMILTHTVRSQGATGAMPPPKLLVNVFFLQLIYVVTFF